MIQDKKLRMSFSEMSLRKKQILAEQSATSYQEALEQVQRLKKNSKVQQPSKKCRHNP